MHERFAEYLDPLKGSKLLDVPDYLKCVITDEIMTEPVILESGQTYEKAMI